MSPPFLGRRATPDAASDNYVRRLNFKSSSAQNPMALAEGRWLSIAGETLSCVVSCMAGGSYSPLGNAWVGACGVRVHAGPRGNTKPTRSSPLCAMSKPSKMSKPVKNVIRVTNGERCSVVWIACSCSAFTYNNGLRLVNCAMIIPPVYGRAFKQLPASKFTDAHYNM